MKTPLTVVGGALLGLFLGADRAFAASMTFQTGDFVPGEWSSHLYPPSTGTAAVNTEPAGGTPGAYRRIKLTVDPFEFVREVEFWTVAQFTPALQGEVSSVLMSYDIARVFSSHPSATQITKGLAVLQDGVIHTHSLGVSVATPPFWEAVSASNVLPLFPLVDWEDGNTLTFGFFDYVGTAATGFRIDGGYDNFRVVVDYVPVVPEPASVGGWSVVLLAGLALLGRRRRN